MSSPKNVRNRRPYRYPWMNNMFSWAIRHDLVVEKYPIRKYCEQEMSHYHIFIASNAYVSKTDTGQNGGIDLYPVLSCPVSGKTSGPKLFISIFS